MFRNRFSLALLLAVLAVTSACATKSPKPGVNVKTITTDLVFGIPPSPVPVAPPNTELIPDEPEAVVVIGTKPRPTSTPLPKATCPDAGPNAFPEAPAISVVEQPPAPGTYKWIFAGTQKVRSIGTIPVPPLRKRQVIKGEQLSKDSFTFTTIEDEVVFGSQSRSEQTFLVRNTSAAGQDAGIFLMKIVERVGNDSSSFEPETPVKYAPIPVEAGNPPAIGIVDPQAGDQIDSVGVDSTNLTALRNRGNVVGRMRIDACGVLVDAWRIEAQQTFVAADGNEYTRKYDYAVATQYGGLIVFEHVENPCTNQDENRVCSPEPDLKYDARIGQIVPEKT